MHIRMKRTLATQLFLSLICVFFAEEGRTQDNYMRYHGIINAAEASWSNNDFESAIQLYDSAFAVVAYVFTKDYLVAAQLSAILKDRGSCIKYLHAALKNGYQFDCLKTLKPLFHFVKEADWNALELVAPQYQVDHLASIDMDLNIEFSHRYRNEQDNKGVARGRDHIYYEILESNYSRVLELLDEKYFLSERVIGMDIDEFAPNRKNTLSGLNSCSAGNSKMLVTILHAKKPIEDIGFAKMMQAVQDGFLHPRQLKAIVEYSNRKFTDPKKANYYIFDDLDARTIKLAYAYDEERLDLKLVNDNRRRIGLCDLQTEENKKVVGFKHKIAYRFGYK